MMRQKPATETDGQRRFRSNSSSRSTLAIPLTDEMPVISPNALSRLRQILSKYSSSMGEVADTVFSDPGLTLWTMRQANSDANGFADIIRCVPQALLITGFVAVRSFACARRQTGIITDKRYADLFADATRIARNTSRWMQGITAGVELPMDYLLTSANCLLGAVATTNASLAVQHPLTAASIYRLAPDLLTGTLERFDRWRFPDELSEFARARCAEIDSSDDSEFAVWRLTYFFDIALRLSDLKLPQRDAIVQIFETNRFWKRLDDETRRVLLQNAGRHGAVKN